MAYNSKYTGKELEERLDKIDGIPDIIANILVDKDFVTKEDLNCILKDYAPADYHTIPIDNNTIFWDKGVLKALVPETGDCIWELKENHLGEKYLYSRLPVVTQYGITMYSREDSADIFPDVFLDIPIDNDTIYWYEDQEGNKVLKAKGGSGEGGDSKFFTGHYDESGNLIYIEALSNIAVNGGITLYVDNETIDLPSLYDGIPIDGNTIYWYEDDEGNKVLKAKTYNGSSGGIDEEFLKDYLSTNKYINKDDLDDALSEKADLSYVNDTFVTIDGDPQEITSEKNFTGGLKVNGSSIVYDATNKYWKLEGDLLITGGLSMYSDDSDFVSSTIMDALVVDGINLKVVNGVLAFVGTSGEGGIADTIIWDNVIGKPEFATVATSGKYEDLSEKPDLSKYLLTSSYTGNSILEKLKEVDGADSGLDADTLDGKHVDDIIKVVNSLPTTPKEDTLYVLI